MIFYTVYSGFGPNKLIMSFAHFLWLNNALGGKGFCSDFSNTTDFDSFDRLRKIVIENVHDVVDSLIKENSFKKIN